MFGNKLKELLRTKEENQEGNDKRKIENLVFFIILLIITVVVINIIWNGSKSSDKQTTNDTSRKLASTQNAIITSDTSKETNSGLEERLKNILSKIQGVGNVEVCLNYSESSETIAMYNETSKSSSTEETDTSGGVRTIQQTDTQKEVVYNDESGNKTPVTEKIINPKIEGAIITAEGASNSGIKANIISAVEAVTGLATHKIQVFEMNK